MAPGNYAGGHLLFAPRGGHDPPTFELTNLVKLSKYVNNVVVTIVCMELPCTYCNTLFQRCPSHIRADKSYCSRSCANLAEPRRKPEGICQQCGNPRLSGRTFCGPDCAKEGTRKRVRNKTSSQAVVDWRQRTKRKLADHLGGECVDCGYSKCIAALHFHHLDPSQKEFTISGVSRSFESLRLEVEKCVLLCANCHAERHAAK